MSNTNNSTVIETSEDGERVRCKICFAASNQNGNKWIKKGSLSTHLSSDIHRISVDSQLMRAEAARNAGEQSVQEEIAMEESMDAAILSSVTQPIITINAASSRSNIKEQEMWNSYETSNITFDAGIDPALAAVKEREKLMQEAIALDIWQGSDFLPEQDSNPGEEFLQDLEQEDIMNELLRNAGKHIFCCYFNCYSFLRYLGIEAPNARDLLEEEAQNMGYSKNVDAQAWSPYESKTVNCPYF